MLTRYMDIVDPGRTVNVLLWVPRFWPAMGGTELHSFELARRLSDRFDIGVVTHSEQTATIERTLATDMLATVDSHGSTDGVAVQRIGLKSIDSAIARSLAHRHRDSRLARAVFSLPFYWHVTRRMRETLESVDLVHFIYNGLTDSAVLGRRLAHKHGVPFVLTPNVLDTTDAASAWNSRRFRSLYRQADALIALTRHEAEYLIRHGADASRVYVIPYGPVLQSHGDAANAREYLRLTSERVILFLGRVVEQKGYKLLIEAFDRVRDHYPDVLVVFMGPATPEVKAHLERVHDHGVRHIDSPDQQLKADLLALCSFLCLPSSAESLGVVYLEAFASSKPVIALDLPVLRDVISDSQDGLLVQPDASSIAKGLHALLADPERVEKMGSRGLDKVKRDYSWVTVEQSVADVYTTVLAR